MRKTIGVIFDMDGLMVDSEPVQLNAINDALVPMGIRVSEDEFIDMVGRKAIDNFRFLKKKYGFAQRAEDILEQKNTFYLNRMAAELKAMPGLDHAISLCDANHLEMIIASSSPRKDILFTLEILGVRDRFPLIASGDQVKEGKPNPEIFLIAARMADKPPTAFVVLEDTGHGVNAAKAAGMYAIAIPNRFTQYQDFSRADLVLDSLEALTPEMLTG